MGQEQSTGAAFSNNKFGSVDVVLGAQLGDEGKGRMIDILANSGTYRFIARCNSGSNAGHKVVVGDKTYSFHMLPSGILNPDVVAIIGNGTAINIESLYNEMGSINSIDPDNTATKNLEKRILISDRAHIVLNIHKFVDGFNEERKTNNGSMAIGTTRQGMGPVYSCKASRIGIRACDIIGSKEKLIKKLETLVFEYKHLLPDDIAQVFKPEYIYDNEIKPYMDWFTSMVTDTISFINDAIDDGQNILVEGAQACLLDVDFGVYPFSTATGCSIGNVCNGLGIPANSISNICYVMKAYCTRVGNGPFPTELLDETGEKLQIIGKEFGTTTGRKRRCGWLDLVMVNWSMMINGKNGSVICLTKLDVLDDFDEIKIGIQYVDKTNNEILTGFPADMDVLGNVEVQYKTFKGWKSDTTKIREFQRLPEEARLYLQYISEFLDVEVKWIGVGADREAMITL